MRNVQSEDCAGGRATARTCSDPTSDCTGGVAAGTAFAIGRYARKVGAWICDSVVGAVCPEENWQHGAGTSGPSITIDISGFKPG